MSFESAKSFINSYANFILASHARTDGDDLGSMLAIFQYLKMSGKSAVPLALGGVPITLKFLPYQKEVLEQLPKPIIPYDAVILFGCCDVRRTGIPEIINGNLPILNIDHHYDNSRFGRVNLIDQNKSSVAELVYDFMKYIGASIDSGIAKCLLTGMLTDTGAFMHANTTASALAAASELMTLGARPDTIFNCTYSNKDLNALRAWGRALENTRIGQNHTAAVSILTAEDLNGLEKINEDTFLGFVDILNTIPGTKFAMFVRQEGDYIKGSIRSDEHKQTDVFKIARLFGGGGHKLASGFKLKGRIIKNGNSWKVLAA